YAACCSNTPNCKKTIHRTFYYARRLLKGTKVLVRSHHHSHRPTQTLCFWVTPLYPRNPPVALTKTNTQEKHLARSGPSTFRSILSTTTSTTISTTTMQTAPPTAAQPQLQPHTTNPDDLEAANVAHFDALGHNFDSQHPFAADFADRFAHALRRRCAGGASASASANSSSSGAGATASSAGGSSSSSSSLILDEDTTSVLDYACGSGQVSRALAPPRMVEVYNTRANTQGLEPHEMRAVNSLAELHHEQRFDLAVCSMAYHHFASVEQVTREIVSYLKPRGTLAVADIARMRMRKPGDAEEEEGEGKKHRPSSRLKGRTEIHFFLATGTKPAQPQ
ncbi:hypothetical protein BJV77DRAFT_1015731, partial [Russula vinacea]